MSIKEYIHTKSRELPDIQPEVRMIYHYTNALNTQSILKDNTFHASDATYLVDAKEVNLINHLINGIDFKKLKCIEEDFLKYSIENLVKYFSSYNSIFIISFSTEENLLPIWISYTNNDGYCLGFKSTKMKDALIKNKNIADHFYISDGKVLYDKLAQLERLDTIIKGFDAIIYEAKKIFTPSSTEFKKVMNFSIDILVKKIFLTSLFYKTKDFEYEQEYRFAFISKGQENDKLSLVDYKVKNGYFMPYLNISFPKETLFNLTINPRIFNRTLAVNGLNQQLKNLGYSCYVHDDSALEWRY